MEMDIIIIKALNLKGFRRFRYLKKDRHTHTTWQHKTLKDFAVLARTRRI